MLDVMLAVVVTSATVVACGWVVACGAVWVARCVFGSPANNCE